MFQKALSKVLFIDEAYRLSEGQFAKEAMDEIVGLLTQDAYKGKLLVILAGYDEEINQLLSVNPGLASRFPYEITFKNLTPSECLAVLQQELSKSGVELSMLDDVESPEYDVMIQLIRQLSGLPSWGNARDVQTLAKKMVTEAFTSPTAVDVDASTALRLSPGAAMRIVSDMLDERRARQNMPKPSGIYDWWKNWGKTAPAAPVNSSSPVGAGAGAAGSAGSKAGSDRPRSPPPPKQEKTEKKESPDDNGMGRAETYEERLLRAPRDDGVSDAIWSQLRSDKLALIEARRRADEEARERDAELERLRKEAEESERRLAELERERKRAADEAEKRRLEQERLRELRLREERAQREAALKQEQDEEEKRKREETQVRTKLRQMGVCGAGYGWVKQPGGYRCAAGICWVTDAQLGI